LEAQPREEVMEIVDRECKDCGKEMPTIVESFWLKGKEFLVYICVVCSKSDYTDEEVPKKR
jgi:hypothetical protein